MSIFSGLERIVEENYPLARHTWFGLGGPADFFIIPETRDQLQTVVQRCGENDIPVYVLGYGSNLLVGDDGVRGAVVKLVGDDIRYEGAHHISPFSNPEFSDEVGDGVC